MNVLYRLLNLVKQDYPTQVPDCFNEIPKERKQDLYAKIIDILSVSHDLLYKISSCLTVSSQVEQFCDSVVISLLDKPDILMELILFSIRKEVEQNSTPETLFRSNNFTTKIMKCFTQRIAERYLKKVIGPMVDRICRNPVKFEIDPDKIPKNETIEGNANNLNKILDDFLAYFIETAEVTLPELQIYCKYLSEEVEKKFPGKGDEILEPKHYAVGGFMFLRVICPAIVDPVKYHLWEEKITPDAQRYLLIISKILQNLANGTFIPIKEQYMSVFAPLLKQWIFPIRKCFESFSQRSLYSIHITQYYEYTLGELYRSRDIIFHHLSEHLLECRDTIPSFMYDKLKNLSAQVLDAGARPILYPPVFIESYDAGDNYISQFSKRLHILLSRTYIQLIENLYEKLEKPIVRYMFNSDIPISQLDSNHQSTFKRSERVEHEVVEILANYHKIFKKTHLDPQVINHFFETIAFLIDGFIANRLMKHKKSVFEIKMGISNIEIWYDCANVISFREFDTSHLKKLFAHSRQVINVLLISPEQMVRDPGMVSDVCPLISMDQLSYILKEYVAKDKNSRIKPFNGDVSKLYFEFAIDLFRYTDYKGGKVITRSLFDLHVNAQRLAILNKIKIPLRYETEGLKFLNEVFYIRLRRDPVIIQENKLY